MGFIGTQENAEHHQLRPLFLRLFLCHTLICYWCYYTPFTRTGVTVDIHCPVCTDLKLC